MRDGEWHGCGRPMGELPLALCAPQVSSEAVQEAFDEAKKCCHPEWSFHPKKTQVRAP